MRRRVLHTRRIISTATGHMYVKFCTEGGAWIAMALGPLCGSRKYPILARGFVDSDFSYKLPDKRIMSPDSSVNMVIW
jgi:hypothetical protein